jgi:aryl-alcohol dehydrogenase-like predicted oxidoreductase
MSQIVLGLWPIAGITTIGVSQKDAESTIDAAIDHGITSFDTAFSYGFDGESDRLLGMRISKNRDRYTVIGKVGQRWNADRKRVVDGTSGTLVADAEASLKRMRIDHFDLLMLHSPDPNTPLVSSATAIVQLQQRGLCKQIGVCNVTPQQYTEFANAANNLGSRCDAIQCPLNLLQRGSLEELIPSCLDDKCDVYTFWVLMKGLLAGRISRNHKFADGDSRPGYDIYQGKARERAHRLLDAMDEIASSTGHTIAQLTIGWVLSQPGVTGALVGARRPDQIIETAQAKPLSKAILEAIAAVI